MGFKCPACNKEYEHNKDYLESHIKYCSGKKKVSRNLKFLCDKLEEQLGWIADYATFKRTYAGKNLKFGGAFVWTMMVNTGTIIEEIGSCYPLRCFAKKDIEITVSTSWADIEIFPERKTK